MSAVTVVFHDSNLHKNGPTRIIPFDLSKLMHVEYPASSPNLLASFLRINLTEKLDAVAFAKSQAFYVIRGSGKRMKERSNGVKAICLFLQQSTRSLRILQPLILQFIG
jgi:hypothetical protein